MVVFNKGKSHIPTELVFECDEEYLVFEVVDKFKYLGLWFNE